MNSRVSVYNIMRRLQSEVNETRKETRSRLVSGNNRTKTTTMHWNQTNISETFHQKSQLYVYET